ncbi:MAG: thiamine phosphate synthase [Nitrospinaceae bacterium]|nr:thiamine phosphate synthase [Nitrospinaceae bacterium]NIR54331.1 thiamine phosphate synthase [Nitrospinaceae bacterium]NIS84749.1 thiamine phosphate synthase [Nitrospinaceae bacterium]NIT81550.1 thiamine phosphate synthase [Nitrospinaceae bacterium]NIU43835.1 thiamine phosphate synthase [Nitrospinaceae bacterium]
MEALRVYLITDRSLLPEDGFLAGIEAALKGGVRAIQLREKNLPEEPLRSLAKEVLDLTQRYHALLFINHRADVAQEIGANGVHLTEASAAVRRVRKQYPGLLIGKSTHSLEGAMRAQKQGADFVTFSPVYDTPSKQQYGPPQGLEKLEQVSKGLDIPVLALGGIDLSRIPTVRQRGAFGVALIRGIWNSPDIEQESLKYMKALRGETP